MKVVFKPLFLAPDSDVHGQNMAFIWDKKRDAEEGGGRDLFVRDGDNFSPDDN